MKSPHYEFEYEALKDNLIAIVNHLSLIKYSLKKLRHQF